jgi:hypothetical protein
MESPVRAVEELGIAPFIDERMNVVYSRLKEALEASAEAQDPADRFTSSTLPIVNGLIHYASSPEQLDRAFAWLEREWGIEDEEEAMSMLSALALLYIVDHGLEHDKRAAEWTQMHTYVAKLSEEIQASAA